MPHGEFGLDVIALVGTLRSQQQRSLPQIHEELLRRRLQVAQRMVTDQLYRYEELLALHLEDSQRLQGRLREQKQVILALDGLQPEVGHEVRLRAARLLLGRGAGSSKSAGSYREQSGTSTGGSREHLPHEGRRAQLRFRRDPQGYLLTLEQRLLTPSLPSYRCVR